MAYSFGLVLEFKIVIEILEGLEDMTLFIKVYT